jgi:hypothetical protein
MMSCSSIITENPGIYLASQALDYFEASFTLCCQGILSRRFDFSHGYFTVQGWELKYTKLFIQVVDWKQRQLWEKEATPAK